VFKRSTRKIAGAGEHSEPFLWLPFGTGGSKLQLCGFALHRFSRGKAKSKFEAPDPYQTTATSGEYRTSNAE